VLRLVPLVLSCLALTTALLGSTPLGRAAEELVLPRNSVGTAQLRDSAVTGAKVKDRSLLAKDFKRGQLPRGAQGPAGPPGTIDGVAAGGALAGSYPNPEIAPNTITGAEVKDGSLGLVDISLLSGQVRLDPRPVAASSCRQQAAPVPGVKPYDRTLVLPTENLPLGLFVTQVFNTTSPNRILFRVCNATGERLDAPQGAWAYVVWR
jgi:hypothetical protein